MTVRRRKKRSNPKLNLVPIMDATFIFIFFLLMSFNLTQVMQIGTDIPIVSDQEPAKDKKPLALTLTIDETGINVQTGVPAINRNRISKGADGFYDLVALHDFLITIKKESPSERSIILNPIINLNFEELVKIMDAVRLLEKTDETIYNKNQDGITEKLDKLFDQIMFGNTVT